MKAEDTKRFDGTVKPFQVRASCGHIVIRKMREVTAGVPYKPETILEAPNGSPCKDCFDKRMGGHHNII